MAWLLLGIVLWSATHLMKSVAIAFRQRWVDRLGADPYRGLVSLLILASVGLMVLGWRTTPPDTNTDRYMFEQFLDQPWCRVGTRRRPTVLTFKRGDLIRVNLVGRCKKIAENGAVTKFAAAIFSE